MELNGMLHLLEERLVQHDNNRKEVQDKLEELCTGMSRDADLLEERLNEELQCSFNEREETILNLIEKLDSAGEDDKELLLRQAREELSTEFKFEIQHSESEINFVDSYKLIVTPVKNDVNVNGNNIENITIQLKDHLNKIHETMTIAQNELTEICTKRRNDAEELKKRINEKLEFHFVQEDSRIQEVVKMIRDKSGYENTEELKTKAILVLLVNQKYSFDNNNDLSISKEVSFKPIDIEGRKPSNIITSFTDKGEFSLSFTFFSDDEIEVLQTLIKSPFKITMKLWDKNIQSEEENTKIITKDYILCDKQICFVESFKPNTTYCVTMRIEHQELYTQWSDETEFTSPEFKICIWKEFPDDADQKNKYLVDETNPRIATKVTDNHWRTIIGNTPLPLNKVTSWSIKILESEDNDGGSINIGVAPSDINQNDDYNYKNCGWYLYCYKSKLCSGPPHNYNRKKYGFPLDYKDKKYRKRKGNDHYVYTGDIIGVVMDTTTNGELSFAVNGVNLGVAYEGIPLDKPLVPCVLLWKQSDSVELDITEVKETINSSISACNITTKSESWDSITLTWDAVEGAKFYQIETDGNKTWGASSTNLFTKRGLLQDTEHSFRVRVMKENKVSEWSNIVKGKTMKAPDFSKCVWNKRPEYVAGKQRYTINEDNPRIAIGNNHQVYKQGTIIGSAPIPHNKVTSWSIKILRSEKDDGEGIFIGVAPFDIDQNEGRNYNKCGWYFYCYNSTLHSGPPHNYKYKEYGQRKEKGEYVHTGNIVGVVMDTTNGELSFVLNGMNLGIAYEGIPLDKPLVPCILLNRERDTYYEGDAVELVI